MITWLVNHKLHIAASLSFLLHYLKILIFQNLSWINLSRMREFFFFFLVIFALKLHIHLIFFVSFETKFLLGFCEFNSKSFLITFMRWVWVWGITWGKNLNVRYHIVFAKCRIHLREKSKCKISLSICQI